MFPFADTVVVRLQVGVVRSDGCFIGIQTGGQIGARVVIDDDDREFSAQTAFPSAADL